MIRRLGEHPEESAELYDVCIIGSGPAGIILASELSRADMRVCVLESGGEEKTKEADSLRAVENTPGGLLIRETARERVIGGSSHAWQGLSAPLDSIDLNGRAWVPSRWPISEDELAYGLAQAAERYFFPPAAAFNPPGGIFSGSAELCEKKFIRGRITRFGSAFRSLFGSAHTDLVHHATVIKLITDASRTRITEVLCSGFDGSTALVRARFFIIAAGGIENARLLLVSNGIGNEHDQVGKYFMDHPKCILGTIQHVPFRANFAPYFGTTRGEGNYTGLRLAESLQKAEEVLNAYIKLEPLYPWTDSKALAQFRSGVAFLRSSVRTVFSEGVEAACVCVWKGIVLSLGSLIPVAWLSVLRLTHRGAPSRILVRAYLEMNPAPENRITLSQTRDRLGVQISHINLTLGDREYRTLRRLSEALRKEVSRLHVGEFIPAPLHEMQGTMSDASHHLGGTRMGNAPEYSVVDSDLRVHGVENLYIVGSSVFPTGGCANPTLTVAALAVRLAEHLRGRLGANVSK